MRIGLIGTGRIGAFHATTLANLPVVSGIVVHDADERSARAVADRTGGEVAGDLAALLGAGLDGVVIAAPTFTHADLIRAVQRAGLPTFCEKPIVGTLLARPNILAPVLTMGGVGAAVFAYIAGATFVLHDLLRLSATMTSVVYGVNALANLGASLLYGRLVRGRRPETLLVIGAVAGLGGQLLLLVLTATVGSQLWAFCLCLLITVASFGFVFPAVNAVGQSRGRTAPGTMSALLGVAQFTFGAAASPLIGLFGTRSAAPMAIVMATFLALTTAGATVCRRQSRMAAA
ncbi:MFS transporter [Streptomyces sp. NPDC002790]|uniref:MFS transporter n=1 Tax=Streptomyces sp. NPDC002790 TaxID=3154431 RepID=UPI0033343EF0